MRLLASTAHCGGAAGAGLEAAFFKSTGDPAGAVAVAGATAAGAMGDGLEAAFCKSTGAAAGAVAVAGATSPLVATGCKPLDVPSPELFTRWNVTMPDIRAGIRMAARTTGIVGFFRQSRRRGSTTTLLQLGHLYRLPPRESSAVIACSQDGQIKFITMHLSVCQNRDCGSRCTGVRRTCVNRASWMLQPLPLHDWIQILPFSHGLSIGGHNLSLDALGDIADRWASARAGRRATCCSRNSAGKTRNSGPPGLSFVPAITRGLSGSITPATDIPRGGKEILPLSRHQNQEDHRPAPPSTIPRHAVTLAGRACASNPASLKLRRAFGKLLALPTRRDRLVFQFGSPIACRNALTTGLRNRFSNCDGSWLKLPLEARM